MSTIANSYEFVMFGIYSLMWASITVVPVVVLLMAAWKGKVVWSGPRCGGKRGKCGYDLRGLGTLEGERCPECGTYLNELGAVEYVRGVFSWRLLVIGVLLALLGAGLTGGAGLYEGYQKMKVQGGVSVNVYGLKPVGLYEYAKAGEGDVSDWMWAMQSYMGSNKMTQQEMGAFCEIVCMALDTEEGARYLDANLQNVVSGLQKTGKMTDELWLKLARSAWGKELVLYEQMRKFEGERLLDFLVNGRFGPYVGQHELGDWVKVWDIKEVKINGEVINRDKVQVHNQMSFTIRLQPGEKLKAGEHELALLIERGFVDRSKHKGFVATVNRADWKEKVQGLEEITVEQQIKIYKDEADAVKMVKDEAFGERLRGEVKVSRALVRTFQGKKRLVVVADRQQRIVMGVDWMGEADELFQKGPEAVDKLRVNFKAVVKLGEQEHELMLRRWGIEWGDFPEVEVVGTESIFVVDLDEIGDEVDVIDVKLVSERDDSAAMDMEIDQVWDGEIVVKGIEVERWDLDELKEEKPESN
ncbi:hypothetical protein JD969_08525 [Planctomycetota bacterium]|nr:hypothetical protein JD969_08525 [Planctomycetota bacterium]